MVSKAAPLQGFDAKLLLGDEPLFPGQERRIGFAFLSPEAAGLMRDARRFFLWEGRFIGEGTGVESEEGLSLLRETIQAAILTFRRLSSWSTQST
jgi:hypothetical protein